MSTTPIQTVPIITCQEAVRLEKIAYERGYIDAAFMERAGQGIALSLQKRLGPQKRILLLLGKGNNAADTYVVGTHLINFGHSVLAREAFPSATPSPLCAWQRTRFIEAGGAFSSDSFSSFDGVIDGIFGTGFTKDMPLELVPMIQELNRSGVPIYATDIPSGLNGDTGLVQGAALRATITFCLGFPKWGFFTEEGWPYVGELEVIDFGLPHLSEPLVKAHMITAPARVHYARTQHKYQRGATVGFAGSYYLPGAAALATAAALRTGAGMVSLLWRKELDPHSALFPKEIVRLDPLLPYKASSIFAGSGIGRTAEVATLLKNFLSNATVPAVIDADGLYLWHSEWKLPAESIFTPHAGELKRLVEEISHDSCQAFVEKHNLILLRKGAPTFIYSKGRIPLVNPTGHPVMATAGSGDVLTGMIAALIAQGIPPLDAAASGAFLHGKAGERAAHHIGPFSAIATDFIDAIPELLS